MRSRAIVIILLVAVALCAIVSVGSAGMRNVTSPMLISAHGAQSAGLVWGGGSNAPAPPARLRVGSQGSSTLIDLINQITRPTWRRMPLGWWGDNLQID